MKQFLKYTAIGISSGIVNIAVYNFVLLVLDAARFLPEADYLIAIMIGFLISVLWSYLLNRRFVFHSDSTHIVPWYHVLLKMYIAYAFTGIVLSSMLSVLWIEVIGIPKEVITVINDSIGLPVNFLINKFWAFRDRK